MSLTAHTCARFQVWHAPASHPPARPVLCRHEPDLRPVIEIHGLTKVYGDVGKASRRRVKGCSLGKRELADGGRTVLYSSDLMSEAQT